jgi:hypothetical protein
MLLKSGEIWLIFKKLKLKKDKMTPNLQIFIKNPRYSGYNATSGNLQILVKVEEICHF